MTPFPPQSVSLNTQITNLFLFHLQLTGESHAGAGVHTDITVRGEEMPIFAES